MSFATRASLLGWCPVLFDKPRRRPTEELSKAREARARHHVKGVPLYPINVLDWSSDDDGDLARGEAAHGPRCAARPARRTRPKSTTRSGTRPRRALRRDGSTRRRTRPSLARRWSRTRSVACRSYVPRQADARRQGPRHEHRGRPGRRGASPVQPHQRARRPHPRPGLRHPGRARRRTCRRTSARSSAGNGTGIKIPMDSKLPLHFVAPPATSLPRSRSASIVTVHEIYRIARVEYAKAAGVTSGVARAYEFESTNRRLGDIAGSFARSEEDSLELVTDMLGCEGRRRAHGHGPDGLLGRGPHHRHCET
jgi:hypothetical protein